MPKSLSRRIASPHLKTIRAKPRTLSEEMEWRLGAEHAVALLLYRCKLIEYNGEVDRTALLAGEPNACLPILRYLFTGFSEAFAKACDEAGTHFSRDMTDRELINAIFRVWPHLNPQEPSIGEASANKFLCNDAWHLDRLLFTLQCILMCCRVHCEHVARHDASWLNDIEWTNTSPQQQFSDHPTIGTESEQMRSTTAWMVKAYRQQLDSIEPINKFNGGEESQLPTDADGAREQEHWLARMNHFDIQSSASGLSLVATSSQVSEEADQEVEKLQLGESLGQELSPGRFGSVTQLPVPSTFSPNSEGPSTPPSTVGGAPLFSSADLHVYAAQFRQVGLHPLAARASKIANELEKERIGSTPPSYRAAMANISFPVEPQRESVGDEDPFMSEFEIPFIADNLPR